MRIHPDEYLEAFFTTKHPPGTTALADARRHLEAIRDRHRNIINGIGEECGCAEGCAGLHPCQDHIDAVAALAILAP